VPGKSTGLLLRGRVMRTVLGRPLYRRRHGKSNNATCRSRLIYSHGYPRLGRPSTCKARLVICSHLDRIGLCSTAFDVLLPRDASISFPRFHFRPRAISILSRYDREAIATDLHFVIASCFDLHFPQLWGNMYFYDELMLQCIICARLRLRTDVPEIERI
jgi:hypothetical protein